MDFPFSHLGRNLCGEKSCRFVTASGREESRASISATSMRGSTFQESKNAISSKEMALAALKKIGKGEEGKMWHI